TQDMGSGTYTALAQLTAETLGIPIDKVTVELGDTLLPEGPFSGGSQVTSSLAPAVEMATAALRAQLCALAAADPGSLRVGLSPDTDDLGQGMTRNRAGNAAEAIAALLAREAPAGLDAHGAAAAPHDYPRSGMGFGAIFVEVGVDADLGEIR